MTLTCKLIGDFTPVGVTNKQSYRAAAL